MVKIKKEDFDKLNQLDRIEYRQRKDNCYVDVCINDVCWYLLILSVIGFATGDFFIGKLFFMVAAVAFIVNAILMILSSFVTKLKLKNLEEEYFSIEVKKGKKK